MATVLRVSEPGGFREKLKRSPAARVLVLPIRTRYVIKEEGPRLRAGARWLVRSREHTNFTYNLTELNYEHLAWFVSNVSSKSAADARGWIEDGLGDQHLRSHIQEATRNSELRHFADTDVRYGRRIGWYALVRALRPDLVIETGTDKGLGSCVIAAALLANGSGRLITMDIDPEAGYLVNGPYAGVTEVRLGDSVASLEILDEVVNLFLHDSDHSAAHERAEIQAVAPHLAPDAIAISDNSHVTKELSKWAEETGRRFLYFQERPSKHWYPGGGIGAAVPWPRYS
jgi:Methyltransferase domain